MNLHLKYNCFLFLYLFTITTLETIIFLIYDYIQYSPISKTIERITINKTTLKIALISDLQLSPISINDYRYKIFTQNFKQTLKVLKKEKVDSIIIAGDIVDGDIILNYLLYNKILNSIYPKEKPLMNLIMGNHEFYGVSKPNKLHQRTFEFFTKQKPFMHKVINGFHFIFWSSENGSLEMNESNINMKDWVEEQINISLKENSTKPIFIITHMGPIFTAYGTNVFKQGNYIMKKLFNKYQNIISISGHSHASLMDETSFYQGEFTAIQTQSISYIDLDYGYYNGRIPKDENDNELISMKNPMGIIMEINDEKILFKRIFFRSGEYYNKYWIYEFPAFKVNFKYNYLDMKNKYKKPYWLNNTVINVKYDVVKNKVFSKIYFKQAYHELYVHSYLVIYRLLDIDLYRHFFYYSDFFKMRNEWSEIITLKVPERLKSGLYNISIIAIDSYDNESKALSGCVEMKNQIEGN